MRPPAPSSPGAGRSMAAAGAAHPVPRGGPADSSVVGGGEGGTGMTGDGIGFHFAL